MFDLPATCAADRELRRNGPGEWSGFTSPDWVAPSPTGQWNTLPVSGVATNPACRGVPWWREGAREISVPGAIPVITEDTVASRDAKRWRLPHTL